MTGKKIKHQQISSESKRNVAFTKRAESLTKKANELSILCGVDAAMVIHKPFENNAILWPSPELFGERVQKFLGYSGIERERKMVVHEKLLEDRLNDEKGDVLKSHKKKNLMESQLLMNELLMQGKSLDEVDLVQLNGLQFLTAEMLKKLRKRDDELNNEQGLQHY